MIISTFLKHLQYEKGVSPHTLIAYKNDLHQFESFILTDAGSFVLENLDRSDIRRWILDMMSEHKNPSTIARKISSLNSFFRYCLRHDILKTNPANGLVLPKKDKRLPSFLNKDEVEALFSQEKNANDLPALRDDLIVEMLIGLGLRRAELISLKTNSINYSNKTVKVLGKRNKERIIPAYQKILSKSRIYIELRNKHFPEAENSLFLTNKGKPIYDKFVYLLIKHRIEEVSTIKQKSPHTLRHSYATLLLNEGADLEIIRELLGHSTLASTQIYTHNTFKDLQKSYNLAHPRMKDKKDKIEET